MVNSYREIAQQLALTAHNLLLNDFNNKDNEPLDGDQTEELSIMFREELDFLNGNLNKCHACQQPEDDDGRCGCTNDDAF